MIIKKAIVSALQYDPNKRCGFADYINFYYLMKIMLI